MDIVSGKSVRPLSRLRGLSTAAQNRLSTPSVALIRPLREGRHVAVSFLQIRALQVAHVGTIQKDERIVPYLSVEADPISLELLSQLTIESPFELGQGFIYVVGLQSEAICGQMVTSEAVEAYNNQCRFLYFVSSILSTVPWQASTSRI